MKPSKYVPVEKSKLYKAIVFYRSHYGLFISKEKISNYSEIEYLTILFALGYILDGGEGFFVKIR